MRLITLFSLFFLTACGSDKPPHIEIDGQPAIVIPPQIDTPSQPAIPPAAAPQDETPPLDVEPVLEPDAVIVMPDGETIPATDLEPDKDKPCKAKGHGYGCFKRKQ